MDIGVYDFETYGLGGELSLLGAYDGTHVSFFHTPKQLINYFIDSDIQFWYAHNGGVYDIKYLLPELKENHFIRYTLIHNSLNLKEYESSRDRTRKNRDGSVHEYVEYQNCRFELRDSFLLLHDSLENLSGVEGFDTEHKKLPYDDYEEHKDKKLLLEYATNDLLALYEVLTAFKDELLNDDHPRLYMTAAATAMNVFKKSYGGAGWLKSIGDNHEIYRNGYYGGRCEVVRRYGQNLHYYDINSLYPSVMLTEQYPLGESVFVRERVPETLGYYKVKAYAPEGLHIPVLPFRDESKKLLFPTGTFEGWYYSPELDLAEKMGYVIEVQGGYAWFDTANPFVDYIEHYYDIKQHSTGAKRYLAKLMLNSLYGKFAQRTEGIKLLDAKSITVDDLAVRDIYSYPNEPDILYEKAPLFGDFIRPHISGFITSYGRCLLYKYFQEVGHRHVYYYDTDSLVTDVHIRTSEIGKDIGQMKLEDEIQEGIFLLPKVYAYVNNKDKVIIKAKGLSVKDLSYRDLERALNGDYSKLCSEIRRVLGIRGKLRSGYQGNFYDTCILKKQIHGLFNKRTLLEDGIHTQPLII